MSPCTCSRVNSNYERIAGFEPHDITNNITTLFRVECPNQSIMVHPSKTDWHLPSGITHLAQQWADYGGEIFSIQGLHLALPYRYIISFLYKGDMSGYMLIMKIWSNIDTIQFGMVQLHHVNAFSGVCWFLLPRVQAVEKRVLFSGIISQNSVVHWFETKHAPGKALKRHVQHIGVNSNLIERCWYTPSHPCVRPLTPSKILKCIVAWYLTWIIIWIYRMCLSACDN